jgi:hypothetical protein
MLKPMPLIADKPKRGPYANTWLILFLLTVQPVQADIYKCLLPNGQTEISNAPCAKNSGTVIVRPDERVSEANRLQAERDLERMEKYLEKFETRQLADEKETREQLLRDEQSRARGRIYESASMDDCLRELAQHHVDDKRRAELESICRGKKSNIETNVVTVPVPVPAYRDASSDGGNNICIQNVMRLKLPPAQQQQRLALCQGVYSPPATSLQPYQPPRTGIEARPVKPCPRDDKFCVR